MHISEWIIAKELVTIQPEKSILGEKNYLYYENYRLG